MNLIHIFTNRNAALLMGSRFVSDIGDRIRYVALIVFAFNEYHSALSVGIMLIVSMLPQLFSGALGAVSDRYNRKNVAALMDGLRGVTVLLILFTSNFIQILAVVFALSVASSLFSPAAMSLVPHIVRKDDLVTFNSEVSFLQRIAQLLGPSLGAFIIASLTVKHCFVIDAASFFVGSILLYKISYTATPSKKGEMRPLYSQTLSFLREKFTVGILFMFGILSFIGGILSPTLIFYLTGELFLNDYFLGIFISFIAVGGIIGSILTPYLHKKAAAYETETLFYSVLSLSGIFVFLRIFIEHLWLVPVFFAFIGFLNVLFSSVGVSMLQRNVPEKMSGTFFGYFNMLTTGITMGGYVLGTVAGSTYTASAVYLYGGVCAFAVLLVWFWFYRRWINES